MTLHAKVNIGISILLIIMVCISVFASETITPLPAGVAMCGNTVASGVDLDMSFCTGGLMMPVGTTGTRPVNSQGIIRFNSDNLSAEINNGAGWSALATAISRSFNNAPSHPIQTVAAAANGFQVSATRDAQVSYSVLVTVTASIVSGQSGYIVLEICPTNSAVAANWLELGRVSSSQVYTLAVTLQGVQGAGGVLSDIVPAGYYARLRSVNVTGAPTYGYVSGQEVLL